MVNLKSASMKFALAAAAAMGVLAGASAATAQQIDTSVTPIVDRLMYPFGSESGTRATVPLFGSQNPCGPDDRFDDRDSQMLVTFSTADAVETGWPLGAYRLNAITFTVRTSDATQFLYDGTSDPINTYLARGSATVPCAADTAFTADTDAGRPLELFGVAFRNGFTAATYGESSPFKPGSAFTPPWNNVRNAYPIGFDENGATVDASSPIKARSLLHPISTAIAPTATPGAIVPDGTEFTFSIPAVVGVREYLQQGFASGRVALLITAMFEAEQETVGSYPNIYTKEAIPLLFPNAAPPRLTFNLFLCKADFNADGSLDPDDLGDYINCYFAGGGGCPQADFNRDGSTDPDDLGDFINAYFGGCQ